MTVTLPDDNIDGMLRAIALIEAMIRHDVVASVVLEHEANQEEMATWLLAVSSQLLPKVCGSDDKALTWLRRLRQSITGRLAGD